METINNLSWTAIADKPWIHLSPSSGSGDKNIEVTVDNYDGYSEDVTGTVTVSCDACKITTEPTVIEVCRCACKCDNMTFTQTITRLPESGATVGTVLATYSILNRCSANRISAYIKNTKTGVQNSLKVNSNEISLQTAIPYNQDESDVIYDIVISFDGHECKTFNILQNALECNCRASIKSLVYESILINGVPQSGIPANTKLLTYELKQYCPLDKLSVVLSYKDDGGNERTRSIRLENGSGFLKTAIEGNNTVNNRPITSTVKWVSETCSTQTFQQEGCKCETALVAESFSVSISTFGVTGGSEIGSYSMNPQNTCPESALTAALKNINSGRVYSLVCNNGKVYLASSDEIAENITKECVNFELTVYYNGFECDRADICQKGVDCNCDDIRGKVSFYDSFKTIQKEGMQAGTVVGEYRLTNPKCEDDNDCFKIVDNNEGDDAIQLQLINGQIKLLNDVPNNEDPVIITYSFTVYYKVNNKWRVCDTISVTQKGLECACSSITISTESGNLPSFPYEGTHGRWILFASGDTGMYKYKGQPNQEFAGVCGKLIAIDGSEYLNADDEEYVENRVSNPGDKIRVIGVPLTPEETNKILVNQGEVFLIPHVYYFYVNIKDISNLQEKIRRTLETTVHFLKRTEEGEDVDIECTDKTLGLAISPDACNCEPIALYKSNIYCDGYRNLTQLGYAYATNSDMTIDAELLECGKEYDICEDSIMKAQYIDETNKINLLGDGDFVILTVDAPVIEDKIYRADIKDGKLYVYTVTSYYSQGIEVGSISDLIEGKKFIPENVCYVSDFTKNFNSANKRLTVSGKVESNLSENARIAGIIRLHYYCNLGKVNEWYCGCKDFALQQANGCVCNCEYADTNKQVYDSTTLEFHHNSTSAETVLSDIGRLSDCINYYLENTDEDGYVILPNSENGWCKVKITSDYYYIYLYGEILDETPHENRSTPVTVYYNYLVGHDEETGAPIYSEDCGTVNITVTDEVCSCDALSTVNWNMQTGETLTISGGSTTDSKSFSNFSVDDCIELFIVDSDENGKYIDPDGYFSAYTTTYSTYGYVYVTILPGKVLDEDKHIVIKGKYKNDQGKWVICDDEFKLKIIQKLCECDDFKRKITTYDTFTQNSGNSIEVAYLSSGCGKGTLYAFDGDTGYSNVEDMPDSLKAHITSMPDPCKTGSFYVGVNPPGENESFSIDFGICQCDDNGTNIKNDNGNSMVGDSENEVCDCIKEFTITDSYVRSCYDVSCNDYNLNLSLSESDLGTISKSGGLQEVATFSVLPQYYESCYRLVVDCSNEGVETYDYVVSDTDSSKYILRMKLNDSAEKNGKIRVDFACKYIGGYSEQICQQQFIRLEVTE